MATKKAPYILVMEIPFNGVITTDEEALEEARTVRDVVVDMLQQVDNWQGGGPCAWSQATAHVEQDSIEAPGVRYVITKSRKGKKK